MKISKLIALAAIVAAFIIPLKASAQNGIITPYSSFGYGILRDNVTSAQRQMGGVGYAMNSGRQINVMNPASYAFCDSLTFLFDMGLTATKIWSKEEVGSEMKTNQNFGGGLDYITMQFPVAKNFGMSVGVLPFSSVGYAFGDEIDFGQVSHQGSGSWNKLYLGAGYKPFRGFALGFNVSYLFGKIYSDSFTMPITGGTALFERQLDVRDWDIDLGAQYTFRTDRRNRFTLGLTYSPKKDFHGNINTYYYLVSSTDDMVPDEKERTPMKGNYQKAEKWGAGLSWEWNNRLHVEADFTYQPWSKAKYNGGIQSVDAGEEKLHDRTVYALGMQYTPAFRGNYFKKIQYRAGAYYSNDYLMVKGNRVKEYGLSLGLGFPVPSFKTIVSLGVDWKHRQATPNALIKEDYINITFGINFNQMWFQKSKIY